MLGDNNMIGLDGTIVVDSSEMLRIRKSEIFKWTNQQTPFLQSLSKQITGYTLTSSEFTSRLNRSMTEMKEKLEKKTTNLSRCKALLTDLSITTDQDTLQALCQRFEDLMVEVITIDEWLLENTVVLEKLSLFNSINGQLNSIAEYERNAARDIGQTNYLWPWLSTSK